MTTARSPRGIDRPRASIFCLVIAFVATLGTGGCARPRPELRTYQTPVPKDGVVFVADGAGGYQCASRAFRRAAQEGRAPVQVVTFDWSHGYLRMVADLVHTSHARAQGLRLAELVEEYRLQCPGTPVYLAGHSAGAMVVVDALERLPAASVDRVVLISPSLSASYDLAQALKAVKSGLHSFHSEEDWVYCGLVTAVLGNSDSHHDTCAGRVGFHAPSDDAGRGKLVQRPWSSLDRAFGNNGGHFGNYGSAFLRAHILPLFDAP
jgi:alpha-beta hydrolase superfamily lysophospholipase